MDVLVFVILSWLFYLLKLEKDVLKVSSDLKKAKKASATEAEALPYIHLSGRSHLTSW